MPRAEEEWAMLYERGKDYKARCKQAEAELSQLLREGLSAELQAIKRHIRVTPKDSKWWMWSHGVKDALEALLETTVTKEE